MSIILFIKEKEKEEESLRRSAGACSKAFFFNK